MKHWKRILAALLVSLMLSGISGALAELEFEFDGPEEGWLILDEDLALDGELALPLDFELPDAQQEAAFEESASLTAPTKGTAGLARANVDSDFQIEDGMLVKYIGPGGDVIVPDGVTSIGEKAFNENKQLTSIVIPDSVTSIGMHAFYYCDHLTRVTLGEGLTYIGHGAFFGCEALDNVVFPESVTDIDHFAFCICESLTSITIPRGVTHIGDSAFNLCRSLSKVTILAPYLRIESGAFADCSGDLAYEIICYSNAVDSIPEQRRTLIHNRVTDPYVAPSYEAPGWTEGAHCTDCGEVFKAQQVIPQIALTEDQLSLKVGDSSVLSIISQGDRTVSWTSSDASVASVADGRVTALKEGTCTVTATLNDGSLTCGVTVTDPAAISSNSLALDVGKSSMLTLSGLAGRAVTWTSSDSKVAIVNAGKVTAVKAGKCAVTAQIANGKALTCNVIVKDAAKLSDTKLSLILGKTHRLKATGLAGRPVTWSSSNTKVATVKGGKISTVKPGKCTITAQVKNGKRLTCRVTVKDGAELSATSLSLALGETRRLTVSNLAKRSVTWSSSNNKVATVKKGAVKAISAGSCTITARVKGGRKLTCHVTVTDTAKLSVDSVTLSVVDAAYIGLTGAGNRRVTWSTSNADVVKISESDSDHSVIYGVKAGDATITAQIANGKTLYCQITVLNPLSVYLMDIKPGSVYSDVYLKFVNNTNAKIVYVELELLQYNNRGDQVKSPYGYYYINENINAHSDYDCHFLVNRDTKSVRYIIKEITFEGGGRWKP